MGEVVVSSEEMDLELQDAEIQKKTTEASVIRWEKFLPRMVLRVLLVEADDSTRQIIAALLRKCSYKVAAVPDGLKAWELLKGKAHNIDLILTEVDLPSISGYALLTLIMEHDVCKNIPVIMMSSNDSVSMVYKCMLRGAADFLVKPVRKNELRNLWQHVWRRQSSTREGRSPQDESVAQQKLEGTSENNTASNPSTGGVACPRRSEKSIVKESEDESSCTKPELEADRVSADNLQHKKTDSPVSDRNTQKQRECPNSSSNMVLDDDDWGLAVPPRRNANEMCNGEDLSLKSPMESAHLVSEVCNNNASLVNTSREAIDLIAAFDHQSCSQRNSGSTTGTNKVDSSVLLDLTLRRSPPSGQVQQFSDERQTLNHSAASAFSWYVNKTWQPLTSQASSQHKDFEIQPSLDCDLNSGNLDFAANPQKNKCNLATDQPREAEVNLHYPQQTRVSTPIAVRGLRFERLCTPYGSVGPPILCRQSDIPTLQSPSLACHEEPSTQVNSFRPSSNHETGSSQKFHNMIDQTTNTSTNLTELTQRRMSEFSENQRQFSSATDPSATNSTDHVSAVQTSAERANEEGGSIPSKSALREAALHKFRLKRKERCFEKKVRYESRKKLAEQRPRVKGQFVRQQQTEQLPADTDSNCGNSLDG